MPSVFERSWLDIYLKLFPLPNESQSSSAPMSPKSETEMTATSVSTVRVTTQLSLCSDASSWFKCQPLRVNMVLSLKHHHVVDNTEHPEQLLQQLPFPQNLLSKLLRMKTSKLFLIVVISEKTLPVLRFFVLTLDSSVYSLSPKCSSCFL